VIKTTYAMPSKGASRRGGVA